MAIQKEDIDKILVDELGKLGGASGAMGGAAGGGVGGDVSGAVGGALGGLHGGALGAKFTAERLPTESYQETITTETPNADLISKISKEFDNKQPETIDGGLLVFKKVTGSGNLNLNPTLLVAIVEGSTVHVTAYAKEGLIKQHSAKKAVETFTSSLDV